MSIVTSIFEKNKSIDILVNNAGVSHVGNAETTSEEDFTRLFNVNVKGVYNLLHTVVPFMKEKGGAILNLGFYCFFSRASRQVCLFYD